MSLYVCQLIYTIEMLIVNYKKMETNIHYVLYFHFKKKILSEMKYAI